MKGDTFQTILALSDERFTLYRLGGHRPLLPEEVERIHQITGRLDTLWDQYRREIAAGSPETQERIALLARSQRLGATLAAQNDDDDSRRAA